MVIVKNSNYFKNKKSTCQKKTSASIAGAGLEPAASGL